MAPVTRSISLKNEKTTTVFKLKHTTGSSRRLPNLFARRKVTQCKAMELFKGRETVDKAELLNALRSTAGTLLSERALIAYGAGSLDLRSFHAVRTRAEGVIATEKLGFWEDEVSAGLEQADYFGKELGKDGIAQRALDKVIERRVKAEVPRDTSREVVSKDEALAAIEEIKLMSDLGYDALPDVSLEGSTAALRQEKRDKFALGFLTEVERAAKEEGVSFDDVLHMVSHELDLEWGGAYRAAGAKRDRYTFDVLVEGRVGRKAKKKALSISLPQMRFALQSRLDNRGDFRMSVISEAAKIVAKGGIPGYAQGIRDTRKAVYAEQAVVGRLTVEDQNRLGQLMEKMVSSVSRVVDPRGATKRAQAQNAYNETINLLEHVRTRLNWFFLVDPVSTGVSTDKTALRRDFDAVVALGQEIAAADGKGLTDAEWGNLATQGKTHFDSVIKHLSAIMDSVLEPKSEGGPTGVPAANAVSGAQQIVPIPLGKSNTPTAKTGKEPGKDFGPLSSFVSLGDSLEQIRRAAPQPPLAVSPDAANKPALGAAPPVATMPVDTTPVVTTPDATTPVDTTPDATTPVATTPDATTPDATTLDATTPVVTTPVATTPDATTPVATTLDATTPDATTLDATTPNAMTDGGPVDSVNKNAAPNGQPGIDEQVQQEEEFDVAPDFVDGGVGEEVLGPVTTVMSEDKQVACILDALGKLGPHLRYDGVTIGDGIRRDGRIFFGDIHRDLDGAFEAIRDVPDDTLGFDPETGLKVPLNEELPIFALDEEHIVYVGQLLEDYPNGKLKDTVDRNPDTGAIIEGTGIDVSLNVSNPTFYKYVVELYGLLRGLPIMRKALEGSENDNIASTAQQEKIVDGSARSTSEDVATATFEAVTPKRWAQPPMENYVADAELSIDPQSTGRLDALSYAAQEFEKIKEPLTGLAEVRNPAIALEYVKTVFGRLTISDVKTVYIDGIEIPGSDVAQLRKARARITAFEKGVKTADVATLNQFMENIGRDLDNILVPKERPPLFRRLMSSVYSGAAVLNPFNVFRREKKGEPVANVNTAALDTAAGDTPVVAPAKKRGIFGLISGVFRRKTRADKFIDGIGTPELLRTTRFPTAGFGAVSPSQTQTADVTPPAIDAPVIGSGATRDTGQNLDEVVGERLEENTGTASVSSPVDQDKTDANDTGKPDANQVAAENLTRT